MKSALLVVTPAGSHFAVVHVVLAAPVTLHNADDDEQQQQEDDGQHHANEPASSGDILARNDDRTL